jgi:hypothetical protein
MVTAMDERREPEPSEDPGASTEQFRAFVRGEGDDAAQRGAPRFPTGVLVLLIIAAVVIVLAMVLMRS